MSQGAEAADQMVQEGIQVTESAVKLAGLGVKNLAVLLLQLLNDNKKLKGQTDLNSLLQSSKPLVTFSMDGASLPAFRERAGDNGLQFSSIYQAGRSGQCDIMVKAGDAALVHRIFEGMQLPSQMNRESGEGHVNQNWLQKAMERLTEPAKRYEGKTGPLEGLGAETLAALVYQLAAENRQHLEASPLSRVFEEGKSLQFVEVPDYCRKDMVAQADVLGVPVHFQSSETPGKVTMMAKSEDAPLLNRMFENMGLEKPMKEGIAEKEKSAAPQKEQPAILQREQAAPQLEGQLHGGDNGRHSVKVAFAKAKAHTAGASVAAAHKAATAKAAAR